MLVSLNLANQFLHIAPYFWRQNFHGANIEIWIDDETPTNIHASVLIIDPIDFSNTPTAI